LVSIILIILVLGLLGLGAWFVIRLVSGGRR
jgi:hypothetical protein